MEDHSGRTRQGHRGYGWTPQRVKPLGADRELGAGRVRQRRGQTVTENGNGRRNVAQGTEMGAGGWRVATAGNVRVGGPSLQERMWVEGATQTKG